MILQASFGKSLAASDLEQLDQGRCTHCCTRVEVDTELANIVAAWPYLSPARRQVLLLLVKAPNINLLFESTRAFRKTLEN
jgi:hypothetical protein